MQYLIHMLSFYIYYILFMKIINILSQIQPIPDPAHRDNHIPLFIA